MNLSEFITKAKKNAYASGARGSRLPDGGREHSFELEGYGYRDSFYGYNPFAGQEIVWRGGHPTWVMQYYGVVLDESIDVEALFRFLRKALTKVDPDRPFRGPELYRAGVYEYRDESHGSLGQFSGTERIFQGGREIYVLEYQGGVVQPA